MLQYAIKKIVMKESLTVSEAEEAMNYIMKGVSTPAQIGAFLAALRVKGETIDEITGCAMAMKSNAIPFNIESYTIDTCGTGGDGGKTFNISTVVALIAAASGIKVAKHGNRAVSSRSGSADVLNELGININMEVDTAEKCLTDTGMAFLFAQKYHTAMKNAASVRNELGMRTVFNILGPITNPADIKGQVMGVFDKNITHTIAEVLLNLGRERAMVVHGTDGLDEITTTAPTIVSEVKEGKVVDYLLKPEDYGIALSKPEEIMGGDSKENAQIILNVLKGEKSARRDIVVLNSAAALYIGRVVDSIKEGIYKASELIDSGKAYEKLEQLREYSKRVFV